MPKRLSFFLIISVFCAAFHPAWGDSTEDFHKKVVADCVAQNGNPDAVRIKPILQAACICLDDWMKKQHYDDDATAGAVNNELGDVFDKCLNRAVLIGMHQSAPAQIPAQ